MWSQFVFPYSNEKLLVQNIVTNMLYFINMLWIRSQLPSFMVVCKMVILDCGFALQLPHNGSSKATSFDTCVFGFWLAN